MSEKALHIQLNPQGYCSLSNDMTFKNCFVKPSCSISCHNTKTNWITSFCYAISLHAEQLFLYTGGEPSGKMPQPSVSDLSGCESDSGYSCLSEKTVGHRFQTGK